MTIDAHLHVSKGFTGADGVLARAFTAEDLAAYLRRSKLDGAVIFTHPEQIYTRPVLGGPTRCDQDAIDSNEYVLMAAAQANGVYPFYFAPLDFYVPTNIAEYSGIKWQRDGFDPPYEYKKQKKAFELLIGEIRDLKLPVILEERASVTEWLIRGNPDITWIIPHCGKCNGGPEFVERFFGMENVYFDVSMAERHLIRHFCRSIGPERLLFGTDYSGTREPYYNTPQRQLGMFTSTTTFLTPEQMEMILHNNILSLIPNT